MLGPSWNNKAVFFIPSESLLIPSNIPDIGLVTNPVKPFRAPVKPAERPYFR